MPTFKCTLPLLHAGARSRQECCHERVPAELPLVVLADFWDSANNFGVPSRCQLLRFIDVAEARHSGEEANQWREVLQAFSIDKPAC